MLAASTPIATNATMGQFPLVDQGAGFEGLI